MGFSAWTLTESVRQMLNASCTFSELQLDKTPSSIWSVKISQSTWDGNWEKPNAKPPSSFLCAGTNTCMLPLSLPCCTGSNGDCTERHKFVWLRSSLERHWSVTFLKQQKKQWPQLSFFLCFQVFYFLTVFFTSWRICSRQHNRQAISREHTHHTQVHRPSTTDSYCENDDGWMPSVRDKVCP